MTSQAGYAQIDETREKSSLLCRTQPIFFGGGGEAVCFPILAGFLPIPPARVAASLPPCIFQRRFHRRLCPVSDMRSSSIGVNLSPSYALSAQAMQFNRPGVLCVCHRHNVTFQNVPFLVWPRLPFPRQADRKPGKARAFFYSFFFHTP